MTPKLIFTISIKILSIIYGFLATLKYYRLHGVWLKKLFVAKKGKKDVTIKTTKH